MMNNFIEKLYPLFLKSTGVSIDTRTVKPGNIFIALTGPNFNGNKYASEAIEKGAIIAVVDSEEFANDNNILQSPIPGMEVLQQLATFHRQQLSCHVLGITGSNGKTTTKELVARVLSMKYKTLATVGNLNNHLGVPLTLLEINDQVEIAIVEMGANHLGEIADLCKIAQPHYGLITNIGEAHTETFGGIEGVLRGKSELFDYLRKNNGTPLINVSDERLKNMAKRFADPITYPGDDVEFLSADPFVQFRLGDRVIKTQMFGSYNFVNMAAAVAAGRLFQVEDEAIAEAIATYLPENQRSQVIDRGSYKIILDAYNANPTSMRAALDNLAAISGKRMAILGDMLEVENSVEAHKKLGEYVQNLELDSSLFCGKEMKAASTACEDSLWFEGLDQLKDYLNQNSFHDYSILIKGSRGMRLETILDSIN